MQVSYVSIQVSYVLTQELLYRYKLQGIQSRTETELKSNLWCIYESMQNGMYRCKMRIYRSKVICVDASLIFLNLQTCLYRLITRMSRLILCKNSFYEFTKGYVSMQVCMSRYKKVGAWQTWYFDHFYACYHLDKQSHMYIDTIWQSSIYLC